MSTFVKRVYLSAKLNSEIYEELEADREALGQAMAVVVLSSLAAGAGSLRQIGMNGVFLGTLSALVGWMIWAYLAFVIGTKLLPEPQTRSNYGELLRTIGFASSPGIIRVLGMFPGLTLISILAAEVWMLAAMIVAVRQALDYSSTWRAVLVCLIGWAIQALLAVSVFVLVGGPANVSQ